jgi:uncharacterized membrane protein
MKKGPLMGFSSRRKKKRSGVKSGAGRPGDNASGSLAALAAKIRSSSIAARFLPVPAMDRVLARSAAAYMLVLAESMYTTALGIDTLAYLQSVDFVWMIAKIAIVFVLVTLVSPVFGEKFDFLLFAGSLFLLAWVISFRYRDYFVILAISGVFTILFLYAMRRGMFTFMAPALSERAKKISSVSAVVLLFLIPTVIISLITCVRFLNFRSPNFDFGIFVNMFHNMSQSGLPMTTNERNGLLSHFAVHLSPIYYLILPFYMVFPSPLTLQIAQAVVLGSSVVPVYLICKVKKLDTVTSLLFCAVVAFFPGMTGGTFYDLHENCFLMPLLLWTFYFFERGKFLPVMAFSLLVCMVKEDAPVYIVFFAMYAFFAKPSYEQKLQRSKAVVFAAFSLLYFFFALSYLQTHGTGIMDWRYGQYAMPDEGLIGVVRGVFVNPSLVFYNILGVDTVNKSVFIIQLLLPLLFLPFAVRKPHRLILLGPMLLLNLMPGWRYQYHIGFQYQFGSGAFLIYAALLNFTDITGGDGHSTEISQTAPAASSRKRPQALMLCMLCVTLFVYSALVYNNLMAVRNFGGHASMRSTMNAALGYVPSDASVSASTMIVAHLAGRSVIYEFSDGTNNDIYNVAIVNDVPTLKHKTEYIVIDMRFSGFNHEMFEFFSSSGDWEVVTKAEGHIAVLRDISGTW